MGSAYTPPAPRGRLLAFRIVGWLLGAWEIGLLAGALLGIPLGTVKTSAIMRPFLEEMMTTRSRAESESVLISSAKRLGVLGRSRPIDQAPNVEIRCVTRVPA